jgi:hypothetical protein
MKNSKFSATVLLLLAFITAKTQISNPEVFLGYKLGTSKSQVDKQSDKLKKLNLLKTKEGLLIHEITLDWLLSKNKYYATPVFEFASGDSLNSKITIIYFDSLNYVKTVADNIKNGLNTFSMDILKEIDGEGEIGNYIMQDVRNELEKKYGKWSADNKTTNMGVIQEGYVWNTGNGLIINLNYGLWECDMIKAAGLRLEFKYTDEMRNKILNKISTY